MFNKQFIYLKINKVTPLDFEERRETFKQYIYRVYGNRYSDNCIMQLDQLRIFYRFEHGLVFNVYNDCICCFCKGLHYQTVGNLKRSVEVITEHRLLAIKYKSAFYKIMIDDLADLLSATNILNQNN